MSKKLTTTTAGAFSLSRPIPVLEPPVKTGNGKATFKTASAAANAAREARDEARKHVIVCENASNICNMCVESISQINQKALKRDIVILTALSLNIALGIFLFFL